jgi:phosphate:Na+ symporter
MDLPFTLLQLAGYVALLLWGVHMVQTGVQRAFGAKLRSFLGGALRSRLNAFLAGIGVTAILQSSTATGLMVTGFAAGGLVDLVPALAVMLGANVGTTLIVQLLSFDVTDVAPALILIGVLMFRRATAGTRDFGRVLIGLGLVLIALSQFVGIVTPYEDVPSLKMFLGAVSNQPLVDVVLAAGLTWAAHSSVAILLLIMSFGGNNVVPPEAAFALVLGANLGTAQPRHRGHPRSDRAPLCRHPAHQHRARSGPRGRGFPHRLQPHSSRRLLPAAAALRGIAAAPAADAGGSRRSGTADVPRPRRERSACNRDRRRRARGDASGGYPGDHAARAA